MQLLVHKPRVGVISMVTPSTVNLRSRLETRNLGWEDAWYRASCDKYLPTASPHQLAVSLGKSLRPGARILDVGCGLGRNSVYLSKQGFELFALDISPTATQVLRTASVSSSLKVHVVQGDFRRHPFAPQSFDAALAVNTIYHSYRTQLAVTVAEIMTLIRPDGFFCLTLLAKSGNQYQKYLDMVSVGNAVEVEPGTFVSSNESVQLDEYLPHHFVDFDSMKELLQNFHVEHISQDRSQSGTIRWVVCMRH